MSNNNNSVSVSSQAILAQVDLLKTNFAQQMQNYNDNIDTAYTNVGVTSNNIDAIVADIKADVKSLNDKFTETRTSIESQLTQSAENIDALNKNIESNLRSV